MVEAQLEALERELVPHIATQILKSVERPLSEITGDLSTARGVRSEELTRDLLPRRSMRRTRLLALTPPCRRCLPPSAKASDLPQRASGCEYAARFSRRSNPISDGAVLLATM